MNCSSCRSWIVSRLVVRESYHVEICRTTYYHFIPHPTKNYHILLHVITYYHILPHITTYYRILPHLTKDYHILLHITAHFYILPHITTYYHILPHITTCYQRLPHITTYYQILPHDTTSYWVWQCVAVCCSVLQCVAVCCSMLQYVAVCCSVLQRVAVCCSVLQHPVVSLRGVRLLVGVIIGEWYTTLYHEWQVCCCVLQHVAVNHTTLDHVIPVYTKYLEDGDITLAPVSSHCNTLQHTATHCNRLQEAWSWYLKNLGGAKFVWLTLWYSSTYWTRSMFEDICTSIARSTKSPKLVPDIFSGSVHFVKSRGDASNRQKIFSIWPFSLNGILVTFACVPMAWYTSSGFTGNVCYKLRLLIPPSDTRTNIPKHASGPISWLILKSKRYKLCRRLFL